tara:strand:+ start:165 stop:326 length:162 start_codon:yes stop_codon:yes gene_type:complete
MPVGVCDRRAAVNGGRESLITLPNDLIFILNAGLFFILVAVLIYSGAPLAILY